MRGLGSGPNFEHRFEVGWPRPGDNIRFSGRGHQEEMDGARVTACTNDIQLFSLAVADYLYQGRWSLNWGKSSTGLYLAFSHHL